MTALEARRRKFEARLGRLLIGVTYVAVALLLVGVALMAANGISPLAGGPALELATMPARLVAGDPAAFLWLGLLAVIATPVTRVVAAAIGFARTGDRLLFLAAIGILATIFASVASVVLAGVSPAPGA